MTDAAGIPARLVAITGATGLIGSALSEALRERGDRVLHLVRRAPRAGDDLPAGVSEARWAPDQPQGGLDPGLLHGAAGIVHLAGAGIGDKRWTAQRKDVLVSSRLDGTGAVARALADLSATGETPRLVSGSAVGYYGDRGAEMLTEASAPGTGFLARLSQEWEGATTPAVEAGVPVATVRTGIVLAPEGGALGRLLPLAQAGLAGPMAGGDAYWPWITLHDHVRALMFLLDHPEVTGPVNLTGPHPDTQADVVSELARQLRRPSFVPAPAFALRVVLGEMAGEIFASARAEPRVLADAGFTFDHPDLPTAMAWVLAQREAATRSG